MTTLQMHHTSFFGLPVTEDLMEVTSDMDQGFAAGEEIDIDLDLSGEKQEDNEDEFMVEDDNTLTEQGAVQGQNLPMSNDDEMADEEYAEGSIAEGSSVRDENLEDAEYVALGNDEDTVAQTGLEDASEQHSELYDDEEQIEEIKLEDQEDHKQDADTSGEPYLGSYEHLDYQDLDSGVTIKTLNVEQENLVDGSQDEYRPATEGALNEDYENNSNEVGETLVPNVDVSSVPTQEILHQRYEVDDNAPVEPSHASYDAISKVAPETSYTTLEAQPDEAEHHESTATDRAVNHGSKESTYTIEPRSERQMNDSLSDTKSRAQDLCSAAESEEAESNRSVYAHPVMVIYQDDEISLFPPVNQEEEQSSTYFLRDEQLASDTITKLLGACRSVLGESISDLDELMIDIDELSLHISEFAPESSTTTLKDLTDIYVHLQHYDGEDNPPPLYVQLTTRPRFSHRLELLMNAIAEKKGLSQIRFYRSEDPSRPEGETASSPNIKDTSQPADALSTNQGGTSSYIQESGNGDEAHISSTSQNTVEVSASPAGNAEATREILEAEPSAGHISQVFNQINRPSVPVTRNIVTSGLDRGSNLLPQNLDRTPSSPPALLIESEPQRQDRRTAENEDFIDYEDDEEQSNETSSGSSTLQGDASDPSNDGLHVTIEKGLLSTEAGLPGSTGLANGTVSKEMTDEAVDDTTNTSNRDSEAAKLLDTLETHLVHSKNTEQQFDSSSDRRDEEEKNLIFLEHSDQPKQGDATPVPIANGAKTTAINQRSDKTSSLQIASSLDQEVQATTDGDASKTVFLNGDDIETGDQPRINQAAYAVDDLSQQQIHEDVNNDDERADFSQAKSIPLDSRSHSPNRTSQISKVEPRYSTEGIDQAQEDEDEITYDDDEAEAEAEAEAQFLNQPFSAERIPNSTRGSLKRARSFHKDDESHESKLQDAKRARSD